METNTWIKAISLAVLSLAFAFIFNYLFFSKLIGVSVFIFTVMLVASIWVFAHKYELSLRQVIWLIPFILFFGLMPTFRANIFLNVLNIGAIIGLGLLAAQELIGKPIRAMKLINYIATAIIVPLQMYRQSFRTLSLIERMRSSMDSKRSWARVLKGLLMALPVLFLFGALFAKADLAFSEFLKN